MRVRRVWLAAALAAGVALPARAQVSVYYHAGGWDAFDGPGDNGQPVCGIGSRNPADGRSFSLRFQIGGDDVIFIAAKTGWTIPDGTQIPVVMQIGLDQPWTTQAVGKGDRVQWTLDRVNAQIFDGQFRGAASMTVTFPSGTEHPWVISLAGSTAASNAMGRCVTDLTQRAAAAQPAATAAPAQQSATQPFGATPAAPDNAAATPPATQDQQPQPNTAPNPSH
ncbi:MAG: hypothetical protein ABSC95_13715 [Acetobacteraceae bacterium]|jgi:hypothetical protein